MSTTQSIVADREGYYYSMDRSEIAEASEGDILPPAEHWEYLGSTADLTPADAVAELEERYPDVSIELTVSTPEKGL